MEGTESLKQKILIVDDSPTNLMMLSESLQADYELLVTTSGESALDKVASNPPNLILLDIVMPGMDGYEVCRRLKENKETRNIPIIFITAKCTEEDEVKGLILGAVDYISKPFRLPIVKARVRTHLELKRKSDILENISNRDGLTGLYNWRQFDTVVGNEWKLATRGGRPLSIILLDLDYFKLYNDNYGHLSGDECLKAVAHVLSKALERASDFAARYGGEEFVVVLPDTALDKAFLMAEKIRKEIEDLKIEHKYSPVSPYVTVSVGVVSTIPPQKTDYRMLLELADNALYEAKKSGRNRVRHQQCQAGNNSIGQPHNQ
ncbi:MAG TPA: diguanylate cyclase [Atribacteraceae bacterium]|nr:diguanylate cyclase [Atribacteraceae bacterium]